MMKSNFLYDSAKRKNCAVLPLAVENYFKYLKDIATHTIVEYLKYFHSTKFIYYPNLNNICYWSFIQL